MPCANKIVRPVLLDRDQSVDQPPQSRLIEKALAALQAVACSNVDILGLRFAPGPSIPVFT
ncbi:hypothetical protein BIWAKO_06992 [Bosea sp. BIWAKO-01]|nr:hypothetical protein BIWAKO_06992 [Bosea sp. BIWAKO-01]